MEKLKDRVTHLLNKAEWTDKEKRWLLEYLENGDAEEIRELMQEQFESEKRVIKQLDKEISNEILENIHERIGFIRPQNKNKTPIIKMWVLKIAAASVIGFLALSAYLWLKNDSRKAVVNTPVNNNKPYKKMLEGVNKTVLTLADGSTILLDDSQNGVLALQGNTKLIKLNGKIAYNSTGTQGSEILYNTISTPRGGEYQVELPDGSQVWLNTASTLRFPTAFVGKERKVEITGEAYFEVAHISSSPVRKDSFGGGGREEAAMPFLVKVNGAEVRVLGTHFNVMAYSDEAAITTTLLEGKVQFVNGKTTSILKPGQQSQLIKNGQVKVISGVDINEVMAWKNGFFDFEGTNIQLVTRQLSRWYDVEIVDDTSITDLFYAKIPRSTQLTDVLKALELTGKVRFKMGEKKIFAMP